MKRATFPCNQPHRLCKHFNPRPREEGDACAFFVVILPTISIHALVKRATHISPLKPASIGDFNPRPREEGDLSDNIQLVAICYFNPRPREEGDQVLSNIKLSGFPFQSTPS